MAFPAVQGTPTDTVTPLNQTGAQTITLPTGITAGEKLLLLTATKNQASDTALTWGLTTPTLVAAIQTGVSGQPGLFAHIYDATGGEGTTTTLALAVAGRPVCRVYRISGAATAEGVGAALVTTATPDPPALTPSVGALDTLWFALAGNSNGTVDATAFPTNYTGGSILPAAAGPPTLAYALRSLNAASEDPAVFTFASSTGAVTMTVGLSPTGVPPAADPTSHVYGILY